MDIKEYEAWRSNNVQKGGQRPYFDPYNKAKKGSERHEAAKEYASQGVEGYHRYSEYNGLKTYDEEEKRNDQSQNRNSSQTNGSKKMNRSTAKVVRNLVTKVATVAMGGVMVVTGYQAIKENEAKANPIVTPVVMSVNWKWNEDNLSATAELLDGEGKVIKTLPAEVTYSEIAATCAKEGAKYYTATVTDDGTSYSEKKEEKIDKLEHLHIVQISETVLETGEIIYEYECEDCHDKFLLPIKIEEQP